MNGGSGGYARSPQQQQGQRPAGGNAASAPPQSNSQSASSVNDAMILDGRSRRFGLSVPWASYCMLRPYVSASVAAAETGRIVGRAAPNSVSADLLAPQVLHTLDKASLPRSLVPVAIQVSSLPPDAFVAYFFVLKMLDGRTLRSFHRFSEVKDYVASMAKVLGAPLVEIGWFPWRSVHHTLVDVNVRRRKLEGYMNMLFTHNPQLQNHPLTAAFFSQSVAIDVSVGVLMPPPVKNNPRSIMPPQPPSQQQLSPHNPNSPLVEARVLMSPSKRLVTMVVDIELSKAFANPRGCAAAAASTLVEKLRVATHNDLSELRVISIGGIAPPTIAQACRQALVQELGPSRGYPTVSDEPNLQLLRALHASDTSGEGLVSSLALGAALSQLGVQLSPEVTSDILLQSYVDGETQALWGTAGGGGGQQLVDYHTFLSLFLARTQTPLLTRPGDDQCLAATARASSGTPWLTCGQGNAAAGGGRGSSGTTSASFSTTSSASSAVDVSTGAIIDVGALGLQRFSLVILASAHAGGAVSAAGGGGKGGGGITPMVEGSAAFIDFKSKCERGLEVVVHKIKWPKVASAVHKAVGIAPVALANDGSHNGNNGGLGNMSGSGANQTGVNPLHDVNRPFLVARSRMIRATDGYTKLVWFKQGFKGAVAKVSRAFNSSLIRPSEQPGAGIFDLLQVTEVRVVENSTSSLSRWFLYKKDNDATRNGSFVGRSSNGSFMGEQGGGGGTTYDRFVAFVGLRESLYIECSSRQERDWLVAGFRLLLFGAEGRARARAFAYGRAMEQPQLGHTPQSIAAMSAASGAASSLAANASAEAAGTYAVQQLASTNDQSNAAYSQPSADAQYVFSLFDSDSNGYLDLMEAAKALVWAGFAENGPQGEAEVRRLFTQFDADGSGGLDVNEFNALMVALEHPSGSPDGDGESLLAKFRSLDAGGGGHLSEFELGQWLGSLPDRQGKPVDDAEVRQVLTAADNNHDGKIDFGEFVKLMQSNQSKSSS